MVGNVFMHTDHVNRRDNSVQNPTIAPKSTVFALTGNHLFRTEFACNSPETQPTNHTRNAQKLCRSTIEPIENEQIKQMCKYRYFVRKSQKTAKFLAFSRNIHRTLYARPPTELMEQNNVTVTGKQSNPRFKRLVNITVGCPVVSDVAHRQSGRSFSIWVGRFITRLKGE